MLEEKIISKSLLEEVGYKTQQDAEFMKLLVPRNNWKTDPIFSNYPYLSNKQKGVVGEHFAAKIFEHAGYSVDKPTTTGHDWLIGGVKTEIKFSLAVSKGCKIIPDKYIINHVSMDKDWDRLVHFGVNPENDSLARYRIYWMHRPDFIRYMKQEKDPLFKHQQGGKKIENDDYICTNHKVFVELPFVHSIEQW